MKLVYSIIFILFITGCNTHIQQIQKFPTQKIILESSLSEEIEILVEIADESKEFEQGLMNRDYLQEGTGMLFIFPEEKYRSFWMKNTIIPLDIIFFDGKGEYVSYESMEPCTQEPCKNYSSAKEIKYALEINKGETHEMGVGEGWKLINKTMKQ